MIGHETKRQLKSNGRFEDAMLHGYITGLPNYASYEPDHEYYWRGSWYMEYRYNPVIEAALRWVADGKPILVKELHVRLEAGRAYIMRNGAGVIERALEVNPDQVIGVGHSDMITENTRDIYNASVCGIRGETRTYEFERCDCFFPTKEDADEFEDELRWMCGDYDDNFGEEDYKEELEDSE